MVTAVMARMVKVRTVWRSRQVAKRLGRAGSVAARRSWLGEAGNGSAWPDSVVSRNQISTGEHHGHSADFRNADS